MPAADWTKEELRTLRRRYSRSYSDDLAAEMGKTEEELERKAAELALSKDKRRFKGRAMPRWTADQIEELRREYPGTANLELARRFGRSVKSLNSKAHNMGLKKSVERLTMMGRENVAQRPDRSVNV